MRQVVGILGAFLLVVLVLGTIASPQERLRSPEEQAARMRVLEMRAAAAARISRTRMRAACSSGERSRSCGDAMVPRTRTTSRNAPRIPTTCRMMLPPTVLLRRVVNALMHVK